MTFHRTPIVKQELERSVDNFSPVFLPSSLTNLLTPFLLKCFSTGWTEKEAFVFKKQWILIDICFCFRIPTYWDSYARMLSNLYRVHGLWTLALSPVSLKRHLGRQALHILHNLYVFLCASHMYFITDSSCVFVVQLWFLLCNKARKKSYNNL